MSKKKAGSTMTLKDFHGGSIPSDLPLPSAPGVTARPPDRPAYDRPSSSPWSTAGRPDLHCPRPGSAGGGPSRTLPDRDSPFLPSTAHIGRNFDEDERKPFDAASAVPRRTPADPIRLAPSPVPKRPLSSPAPPAANPIPAFHPPSTGAPNAWAARKEVTVEPLLPAATVWSGPAAVSRLAQSSAIEKVSSGRWHSKPQPDVDVIRFQDTELPLDLKPMRIAVDEMADLVYEMERGGRIPIQEVVKEGNPVATYYDGAYEHERVPADGVYVEGVHDYERGKSLIQRDLKERNLVNLYAEGARLALNRERVAGDKGSHVQVAGNYERPKSTMFLESKERSVASVFADGSHLTSNEERYNVSHLPQQGRADVYDRSKLKLFPRTKQTDTTETQLLVDKQVYLPFVDSVHVDKFEEPTQVDSTKQLPQTSWGRLENFEESQGNLPEPRPVSSSTDAGGRVIERPRLNLKPRSQPLNSGESAEIAKKSLFGGARPRELVLKERGIDTMVADNFDVPSPNSPLLLLRLTEVNASEKRADNGGYFPDHWACMRLITHESENTRVRNDNLKTDSKLEPADLITRHGERTENYLMEQRSAWDTEKKDNRLGLEKADLQRGSWKSENRKNTKEIEMPIGPRSQEPESWRKPIEQPKPEAPGPRLGKAASALQLAQAFSKSVSDPKSDGNINSRSLPGRPQAPFSRLTSSRELYPGPAQRKINGY